MATTTLPKLEERIRRLEAEFGKQLKDARLLGRRVDAIPRQFSLGVKAGVLAGEGLYGTTQLNVGAGYGIIVNEDSIEVDITTLHTPVTIGTTLSSIIALDTPGTPQGLIANGAIARGDLWVADAAPNMSRLPIGGAGTFLGSDGSGPSWTVLPGSFTGFANPSAQVGLTPVNGAATTAMRSDGAPALDQGISPAWTSNHEWTSATSARPILTIRNTNADTEPGSIFFFKDTVSPADDDELGIIEFFGRTSTAALERYGYILAESSDVTNADTGGSLDFRVAMNAVESSLLHLQGFNGVVDQGEVVVNEAGNDVDFLVRASGAASALSVQGSSGRVGMNVPAPDAQLSIDQPAAAAAIPALKVDQADVSEPCILYSVSGADADIVLWELEVTGTPSLFWDESQNALQFSHALSIRATPALASGLYVPWVAGDALGATAYFGSDNASNNETAVFAISDSGDAIIGLSEDADGILGITNAADATANGVKGSATDTGRGVYGTSGAGIGGEFASGTGYALIANLTGAGSAIVEFRDNGTPVLTIQDGGQADFLEYLRHLGDLDTFWRFQTDRASLDCGGVTFLDAVEAATDYLKLLDGLNVIGPTTSNTNMTVGLMLDQGPADDEAVNIRSDVGAVWAGVETGTWLTLQKAEGVAGGVNFRAFKDSGGVNHSAIRLSAFLEEDCDIDKTTAARGITEIQAYQTDGTTIENTVANGNLLAIITFRGGTTVATHWFDEDGDIGYGGALVPFDDLEDAEMARDLQLVLTGRQGMRYDQDAMIEAGILHPSKHGIMVSHKKMTALQLGADAQAYDDRLHIWDECYAARDERHEMIQRIEYLERQLARTQ